ncbi:hypothetical protein NP493_5735g00000 [Ridgeia piscesae]|uniref:Uncharacterized protein n=1 Tax=Ridgeia piscesae TaxID=27915 RepID=A0AAD9MRM6_RIDPI|nr:hypothetical protein NP493_5735g00000 [Ridgeia piscesae]
MIVFLQVTEIRRNLFQSADFQLTTTELKDHITAMVTLLEDPTQLKNDAHATQAVQQLHQIEERPLQTNDPQVLDIEQILWKQKIHCLMQDQSLSQQQLANIVAFVTALNNTNSEFHVDVDCLNVRVDRNLTRTDDMQAEGIYAFCDVVIRNYHLALHQKFPRQPCDGPCQYEWEQDILSQLTPGSDPGQTNPGKPLWEREAWEIAEVLMGPTHESFRAGGGENRGFPKYFAPP